jgi:hypothetical protein
MSRTVEQEEYRKLFWEQHKQRRNVALTNIMNEGEKFHGILDAIRYDQANWSLTESQRNQLKELLNIAFGVK